MAEKRSDWLWFAAACIALIIGSIGISWLEIPWFAELTPFLLIFLCLVLGITSARGQSKELTYCFLVSIIAGYFIELLGVQTGFPFGEYSYGNSLGIKLVGVPIIIGLNWFIISYCCISLIAHLNTNAVITIILSAALMLLTDWLIEPFAINNDLWKWELIEIPLSNYISWFVIGLIFCSAFYFIMGNRLRPNKIAALSLVALWFFFGFDWIVKHF